MNAFGSVLWRAAFFRDSTAAVLCAAIRYKGKQAWDDGLQLEDKHCGADAGSDGGLDRGSLIL